MLGARVVAVCRGGAKAAALRALGADAVVDTAAAGKDVPLRQLIKAWRPHSCASPGKPGAWRPCLWPRAFARAPNSTHSLVNVVF